MIYISSKYETSWVWESTMSTDRTTGTSAELAGMRLVSGEYIGNATDDNRKHRERY
jgi:hypothetical protein